MEQTKEELQQEIYDLRGALTICKASRSFHKENTATMYTHSEVLKIAEYVKKSAAEIAIMANHNEDAHNTILRIDVNQFIPKKG